MFRISTAQRTKARSFGSRGKISPAPFCQTVGDDDVDVGRDLDQMFRIERYIALMQLDLGHRAQTGQATLTVILAPHLRRVGQKNLQDKPPQ